MSGLVRIRCSVDTCVTTLPECLALVARDRDAGRRTPDLKLPQHRTVIHPDRRWANPQSYDVSLTRIGPQSPDGDDRFIALIRDVSPPDRHR